MIELPDESVVYPQKKENPDYLLVWIPASEFQNVTAGDADKAAELAMFYPQGVEAELTQEGLSDLGLTLDADISSLGESYRELHAAGLFAQDEMVKLTSLMDYSKTKNDEAVRTTLADLAKGDISIDQVKAQPGTMGQLLEPPKRNEGDDPEAAYKKLG